MSRVLALAAAAEAATGVIVFALPSVAVRLLFGAEFAGAGVLVTRMAGIAIIGLGIACWPGASARQPHYGMLAYGALVTLYFAYAALTGAAAGLLLWPAVVVHAVIVALLVFVLAGDRSGGAGRSKG